MSVSFEAGDVVRWCGAELVQGAAATRFEAVSIDTRQIGAGALFVAIRGPRHDAHRYLGDALARGAAGLVIERGAALPPDTKPELPVLAVDDTTRALGRLAAGHREGFAGPLVAITGSNGKTSTKEMCAEILGVSRPCLRNRGNLNNAFGLPLTLLEREPEHCAVVVELGMNHRGEISALAEIARPTVGVVTNVGTAHIEHLGSQEAIALEKGDLVAALAADGTAVLNADDPRVAAMAARTAGRVVRFGRSLEAEVRAERVARLAPDGFSMELVTPEGRVAVRIPGLAEFAISNALAAAAGALAAGARLDDVVAGLATVRPIGGRMERIELPRNVIVINDTYNANPQSMEGALRALARAKGTARGFAVLGEMGELGDGAEQAHLEAGRLVAELGFDRLLALGTGASAYAEGARSGGMTPDRILTSDDPEVLIENLRDGVRGNDWVLVKGSRSARMERIVQALAAQPARSGEAS